MPAKQFVDWQIPDPRHMDEAQFRDVRDLVRTKVKALLQDVDVIPA
jgi:protein-tyrosine-phosphatase